MVERTCAECEVKYEGSPQSKFCGSKCRYRYRDKAKKFPCAGCGELIHPGPGRVKGDARCRDCRTQVYVDARLHGSASTYDKGCRCEPCTAAIAARMRDYVVRYKEKYGMTPSQKCRPRTTTTNCTECGGKVRQAYSERPVCKRCRNERNRNVPIPRAVRLAIYERDNWTCQLCDQPVDVTLHGSHKWAATLDHIECRSWALIPDHTPRNLRLAHRTCNSKRGNRV